MTRVNKPFHSENTSTLVERVPGGRGMEEGGGGGGGEGFFKKKGGGGGRSFYTTTHYCLKGFVTFQSHTCSFVVFQLITLEPGKC